MATRKGLVRIKDLIKNGELSSARKYTSAFVNSLGVYGRLELTVEGRFVYAYAKKFGYAFPCLNCRVPRNMTLKEIFDDLSNR